MKIRRWTAVLVILALLCACMAQGEEKWIFEEEWYLQAVEHSVMSVGNNARLKKVIEKAQNGEGITLAAIGGSVTEGAGADTYQECWASQLWTRLKNTYGTNNGNNVFLVNAGVGGTASPFGYMRYQREIVDRVPAEDKDGLPETHTGDPGRGRGKKATITAIGLQ